MVLCSIWVQQFAEVPRTVRAALPVMAPLPVAGGLGTVPIGADRTDPFVLYVPLPAPSRDAWQSPVLDQRADEYREAGANLAANVFDMIERGRIPRPDGPVALPAAAGAPRRAGRHDNCRRPAWVPVRWQRKGIPPRRHSLSRHWRWPALRAGVLLRLAGITTGARLRTVSAAGRRRPGRARNGRIPCRSAGQAACLRR